MTTSRFLTLGLILCLISICSLAQNKIISGEVIDSKTQMPIPHVEVFVSGTTSGCITDSLGKFTLEVPFLPCVLVADHVSYESFIQAIKGRQQLNIKLKPSNFSLHEVSISAKNKRKKNLRYFNSHFINANRNQIEILNDSVLIFERDKMKFKASTNEPLLIENYHLGYRIRVLLEEFEVIALDGPNGKQIPLSSMNGGEVMQVSGYYFYESLENKFPMKKEKYIENRRKMYYGSYRHFLKSIFDEEPENHGFEILTPTGKEEDPLFRVYSHDKESDFKKVEITADTINITYHFDDKEFPIPKHKVEGRYYLYTRKSTLYANREPFILRENGTSPQLTFVIDGLMAIKSFANSLPDDYQPPAR